MVFFHNPTPQKEGSNNKNIKNFKIVIHSFPVDVQHKKIVWWKSGQVCFLCSLIKHFTANFMWQAGGKDYKANLPQPH